MSEKEYLERRRQELMDELEKISRKQDAQPGEDTQDASFSSPLSVPRMVTIREAAKETHLAENYIRFLCKTKSIVFVRAGNKYLINYEKLVRFLNGEQEENYK